MLPDDVFLTAAHRIKKENSFGLMVQLTNFQNILIGMKMENQILVNVRKEKKVIVAKIR